MIDPLQIALIIVISTLTVLLVIIGIEVYRILREAKKTMHRVNDVLDDVETITNSIATPVEKMSHFVQGMQQGATFVHLIGKLIDTASKKKA